MLLSAVCCLFTVAPALCVGPNAGGHFRDGSLAWSKLEGNTVQFELLSTWKRSHSGHLVHGVTAEGRIFVGDEVTVGGQVPPKLDFGDGAFQYVVVKVTSFSEEGDWFSGVSIFTHTYTTPNNGWRVDFDRYGASTTTQGAPWSARFSGCCRWEHLVNEANEPFKLDAIFDLVKMTGSPGARSLEFSTACSQENPVNCKIPGQGEGAPGPCNKVPFTTIACGNAVSSVGEAGGFVTVPTHPEVNGIIVDPDGTIRTPPKPSCLDPGQRTVGISVRDGTVGYVAIKNPGINCPASGQLQIQGGATLAGKQTARGTFESENGKLKRINLEYPGQGYKSMPSVFIVDEDDFPCTGYELEAVSFETQVNILVGAIERHGNGCIDQDGNSVFCILDVVDTEVKYQGTVIPQWLEDGFPGMGWGWNKDAKRLLPPSAAIEQSLVESPRDRTVNGGTGQQTVHSHMVAYAGYELELTFKAFANWCQLSDMSIMSEFVEDSRCWVKGTTVTFKYGPYPTQNVAFSIHKEGAITDLMITYDNPFEAHRPQHEFAVNKLNRDYVDHPNSVQAASLGFTRIDFNLNFGVGGAAVYLWYKKYDGNETNKAGQQAITHINVSTSAAEERMFASDGYTKLEGNLNEQAGGSNVFIWYKKSSGHVTYQPHRPTQWGWEHAIMNITIAAPQTPYSQVPDTDDRSDVNMYFAGTQTAPGWVKVQKNLNAGTVSNSQVYLFWRRGHSNPTSQTMTWKPCACDVGRQYLCVAPQTSQMDSLGLDKVTGEERCMAIDVLPDALPQWVSPQPDQVLEFYMGKETRYPISVQVLNPDKEVNIEADLPPGAALDIMTRPTQNCSHTGQCYTRSRDLAWTPAWNQGGYSVYVCFKASDIITGCEHANQQHETTRCATLLVRKCVYAVNFEQHLQELASLYKTDWLNVYSMNPTIKTPDRVLFEGQLVNIGHLYSVVPGDTVSKIAKVICKPECISRTLFSVERLCISALGSGR